MNPAAHNATRVGIPTRVHVYVTIARSAGRSASQNPSPGDLKSPKYRSSDSLHARMPQNLHCILPWTSLRTTLRLWVHVIMPVLAVVAAVPDSRTPKCHCSISARSWPMPGAEMWNCAKQKCGFELRRDKKPVDSLLVKRNQPEPLKPPSESRTVMLGYRSELQLGDLQLHVFHIILPTKKLAYEELGRFQQRLTKRIFYSKMLQNVVMTRQDPSSPAAVADVVFLELPSKECIEEL
eukprot:88855-Rhodomonas_salina.2